MNAAYVIGLAHRTPDRGRLKRELEAHFGAESGPGALAAAALLAAEAVSRLADADGVSFDVALERLTEPRT